MTVTNTTARNQYTATAGQTVFAYTFEVYNKNDLVVLQNDTTLAEGTNYTVSGVGSDSGGNITLTVGATAGDIITVYRDMALERLTDYQNSGDFLAAEVNEDFDRLWLAVQQGAVDSDRAIVKPVTDLESLNTVLPVASSRANKFLSFDSNGNVQTLFSAADPVVATDATNVSYTATGTGAVGRTVQSRLTEYLSVKDFGAVGDGVTDDTAAIQAAVNAAFDATKTYVNHAGATKNRPQVSVNFESGAEYLISSTITVAEGVRLIGNNCTVTTSSAINMIHLKGSTGAYYSGAFSGIENMLILGNDVATKGVLLEIVNWSNYSAVTVQGCDINWTLYEIQYSVFANCSGHAGKVGWYITARPTATSLTSIDNVFYNCAGNRNSKYGLWLQSSSFSAFYRFDASRNLVANVLIGGEINGYLPAYTVTNGGSGYPASSFQTVTISGGTGTEAQAYAEIDGSGSVIGVYSLDGGTGYTTGHTITVGGGGSGAVVTATAVDDAGLGDWDGPSALVRSANCFYDFKSEMSRDGIPSCGYCVWQRTGRNNVFTNSAFSRQSQGTARPSEYVKFARCDDFGLSFEGLAHSLNPVLKPGSTTDSSLFKSSKSQGLYVDAIDYTYAGLANKLAVDESDSFSVGAKAYVIAPDSNGRRTSLYTSEGLTVNAFNRSFVTGDSQDRHRYYVTGQMRWGDGSNSPDTIMERKAADTLGLGSGDSFRLDKAAASAGGQVVSTLQLKDANNQTYHLYVDTSGRLKIHTAKPSNELTGGTVVGTQT
jgi:hypothetical protein